MENLHSSIITNGETADNMPHMSFICLPWDKDTDGDVYVFYIWKAAVSI